MRSSLRDRDVRLLVDVALEDVPGVSRVVAHSGDGCLFGTIYQSTCSQPV